MRLFTGIALRSSSSPAPSSTVPTWMKLLRSITA